MKGSRKRFSRRYCLCSRVCRRVFVAQIVAMQVFVLGRRGERRRETDPATEPSYIWFAEHLRGFIFMSPEFNPM